MSSEEQVDFNEEQVKNMLKRSPIGTKMCRWISVGNACCGIKMNWVTFLLATLLTWGFALLTAVDSANAITYFGNGKSWVSANFTWFYILTQDVWCLFLIYLCFSRFGSLKLGREDEKPRYNDFTWFSMLFTCGVAVGLYVFGVAEPLYFYRQPTTWHNWNYDYHHTKTSVETDAQRAQQAIFMAIYHWGIHGWVPYILLALTLGVVSFRWGLPPTIRSCFYPLLGDHALGPLGDIIDSLSVATTTFGVCTSLGLGVSTLAVGLEYVRNINCDRQANCVAAGGVWRLDTIGPDTCFVSATVDTAMTYDTCSAEWLATADNQTNAYYVIIIFITLLATVSVLTGLDRGIMTLASAAFTCGLVVLFTVMFSDNTWYLLSIMVQTTGYYVQNVVQVGFDCEAFQQLAFEMNPSANHFWGSQGELSVHGMLERAAITVPTSSADCGDQINYCTEGFISAAMLSSAGLAYMNAHTFSARSNTYATDNLALFNTAYISAAGVPCGSVSNTTHADAATSAWTGVPVGTPLCPSSMSTAAHAACTAAWTASTPRCPETTYRETMTWGRCNAYRNACPITATYYDDSNPEFMNWWTIFYWAWWITWAPFVGFFVALISRGRTVREVIIGGFFVPTLFAIIWFSVFGGLAIKMERTAEMALQVRPDWKHAQVTCLEHYNSGGVPISPESKRLANEGYYMLTCLPKDHQMYKLMEPYDNRVQFIHFFLWIGLVIYFLTSSDSGSMVDDIITASGLSAQLIPWWQKVFWCWTEGLVALALIRAGGALRSLQHLSIIIGLPYTFLLCMMVPSLYRGLKREMGDKDILESKKFNTQILDFMELFNPNGGSQFSGMKHFSCILISLFCPAVPLFKCFSKVGGKVSAGALAFFAQVLFFLWIIFHITEGPAHAYANEYAPTKGHHVLAWVAFIFFLFIVILARLKLRVEYNIWGSYMDDLFAAMFMWPFALAQMWLAAESDNKDAPTYFASTDALEADMKALNSSGATKKSDDVSSTVEEARA